MASIYYRDDCGYCTGIYFRMCAEYMVGFEYLGLPEYAAQSFWTNMRSLYGAWIILVTIAIIVDDYFKWLIYKEEMPRYQWWFSALSNERKENNYGKKRY